MRGTIQSINAGHAIRFELQLRHHINTVWLALTEPSQLVRWLADADVELFPGGQLELRFSNTGSVITGRVTAAQVASIFEFTWTSPGEVASLVRWELTQAGANTNLMLTHTFEDSSCEQLASMLAGWHTHLEGLPNAIVGHHVAWPWDRWHELHAAYKEQMGHGDE